METTNKFLALGSARPSDLIFFYFGEEGDYSSYFIFFLWNLHRNIALTPDMDGWDGHNLLICWSSGRKVGIKLVELDPDFFLFCSC